MKVPGSLSWMSELFSGVDWYESVADLEKECKACVLQSRSSSMLVLVSHYCLSGLSCSKGGWYYSLGKSLSSG